MARFDVSGLDEVIRQMAELGELSGPVADRMLMAGAEQVRLAWQRSAQEHDHRDTGDMIRSIGYPRAPRDIEGVRAIDIYPQGTDGKGVRNAEKAFILHYGTRRLPGSRWIDDADAYAGPLVQAEFERIWDEYIRTGKVPAAPAPLP